VGKEQALLIGINYFWDFYALFGLITPISQPWNCYPRDKLQKLYHQRQWF